MKKLDITKSKKGVLLALSLFLAVGIFLLPKTAYLSTINPEKIIELTNKERAQAGLNSLQVNSSLSQAAYEKAKAIFAAQKFEHNIDGKKFSTWVKETGYNYIHVGENLAINFVAAEGVINGWLASPLHRENIFNSVYKEIGVAVMEDYFDGEKSVLVVQIFGNPVSTIEKLNYLDAPASLQTFSFSNTNLSSERLLTYSMNEAAFETDLSNMNLENFYFETPANEANKLFVQLENNNSFIIFSYLTLALMLYFYCHFLLQVLQRNVLKL